MTDTPTVEQLLSCPFCGGEAQPALVQGGGIEWGQVECVEQDCGAIGPTPATEAQAIAAWNTRTQQPRPDASVDGLRDAIIGAYQTGASEVHEHWAAGNYETEPDFYEAASDYADSVDLAALTAREAVVEECARAAYRRNPFLDCHEDSPNYGLGAPRTDFDRGRERGREEAAAAIRALAAKDVAS